MNCCTGTPVITKAWFENMDGEKTSQYYSGEPVCLVIESTNPDETPIEISLSFWDNLRRPLWNFTHEMHGLNPVPGSIKARTKIIFYPPHLTVPELLVDMAVGPKGGFPYYDHIIDGMKCSIIEKSDSRIYKRYPEWPIFCRASMVSEPIECQ